MTLVWNFIFDVLALWWDLMISHTATSYVVLIVIIGIVAVLVRNSFSD